MLRGAHEHDVNNLEGTAYIQNACCNIGTRDGITSVPCVVQCAFTCTLCGAVLTVVLKYIVQCTVRYSIVYI